MSECKCLLSISLLGDGCQYCQPQTYIDNLEAWLKEERARVAELERQLLEARMDALPAMREYARKNPKHHFSTDGTEQDPNGAHAWLERNDKPNTEAKGPRSGPA